MSSTVLLDFLYFELEVLTRRHINGTVAIVMTHLIHEHEINVFTIDVKNEVGSLLEDFLGGFLVD